MVLNQEVRANPESDSGARCIKRADSEAPPENFEASIRHGSTGSPIAAGDASAVSSAESQATVDSDRASAEQSPADAIASAMNRGPGNELKVVEMQDEVHFARG